MPIFRIKIKQCDWVTLKKENIIKKDVLRWELLGDVHTII